jgi:hypothetical protein
MVGWKKHMSHQDPDSAQYVALKDDPPPAIQTMREAVFAYWLKLECKFGIAFLEVFSLLTFPLLILISLIFSVQYQPLIYLLLISALIVMYFTPPIMRSGLDCIKCYAVPMITMVYRFMNSGTMSFATLLCLWLFTALYYVLMDPVVWAFVMRARERDFLDPFGYAYLLTAKNIMR